MKLETKFEKIQKIEKLDNFNEEWVYDIEVDDETHSFIANDILVHNSIFLQFESAINSIRGASFDEDSALALCIAIDRYRLSEYFDRCFEKYALTFNTKNRLKFKLENFSEYGIWLKKKNYAIKVAYSPNPGFDLIPKHKRKLKVKGLDAIKGSYPDWARKNLFTLYDYLLDFGKGLDLEKHLVPKLKELRAEFDLLHPSEVTFNFYIRVYNKYVDNIKSLSLKKGISIYPRAAAYYNYLLIQRGLTGKYPALREKDKIKFYYCAPNEHEFDVFAYSPESYPEELALSMDKDRQFFSLIVEPINKILEAMQITPLDTNLNRQVDYVVSKSKKPISDDQFYPLFVVNRENLEHVEVPQKFWKIIGNPEAKIPEEDFAEYLSVITTYGLNSTIVPRSDLEKYLKRLAKKQQEKIEEDDSDDSEDDD